MRAARDQDGRVLMVAVLAAAVLGTGCGVVDANLSAVRNNSRWRRAMGDLHAVAAAVEAYAEEAREYPQVESGMVEELVPLLVPRYSAELEPTDPWGRPYRYLATPDGWHYLVATPGCDGLFEPLPGGPFLRQGCEPSVLYADGQFLQYPEGYQCDGCNAAQIAAWVERDRAAAQARWQEEGWAEMRVAYEQLAAR